MPSPDVERLRSIKTFPSLVKYLRDELEWPIESEDFDDLTFDYEPEELGIDTKNAAKIKGIKQLRPLESKQPWGVFFVMFEPKRLPVVALRRILRSLVVKKRASAARAHQATWQLHDLLFISSYGEAEHRDITFAHFSEDPSVSDLPTLKVLGWDDEDTALHLGHAHHTLKEKLRWPDDPDDLNTWRTRWSSAFILRHREVITTSRQLAVRLADLARSIRKRVNAVLAVESEKGPLRKLMEAFQQALIHDLQDDDFADMYAQTIAYGLLSARVSRPAGLVADDVAQMVPITSPFLRELMETFLTVGGRKDRIDFDELGVSEVVDVLREAKMEAVLRDFGDKNPQEDPVIHFYELFLKEYDAKKRMQRGVFYTPRPVVSFIVRSVDELLRTEFGLEDGLADTTTWGEMAEHFDDFEIPKGATPNQAFVQILDPATGTATFLVEVIGLIHKTMTEKWQAEDHGAKKIEQLWNVYVPKHLLLRLHGYELLMAPYAIAHMKIGLKLYETGYRFESDERARVYLTNALEPPQDFSGTLAFAIPALAHEAEAVNAIKRDQRFTVVIGNPPYSVSSWNTGEWITSLVEDYKRSVRSEESQIQSLSNDYIKFMRFGEFAIETSGAGILGIITGHGYLLGTQARDLRRHISSTFDCCYCLDLHGSIRRAAPGDAKDEPVFQIMTGVAILAGLRRINSRALASAFQASLVGTLESAKWPFLLGNTITSATDGVPSVNPAQPNYFFYQSASRDEVEVEYKEFFDLPSAFGTGIRGDDKEKYWATGFATQQDDLAISFSAEEVAAKMRDLADSKSFEDLNSRYRLCTTNQWNYEIAKEFAASSEWRDHQGRVTYRPFDQRWTVKHKHVLTIMRKRVMSQLTGRREDNLGLVSSRAVNDLRYAHCFITKSPIDKIGLSSKSSTNAYVFPLYIMSDDVLLAAEVRPNLSQTFVQAVAGCLGIQLSTEQYTPEGLSPEDLLMYLYAILHSPRYRDRYGEMLKIDFPRVPLANDLGLFRSLSKKGCELVDLHLMDASRLDDHITTLVGFGDFQVEKVSCSDETVWIDKAKTRGFRGVPEEVWNFHIGGYQVCEKWLKDRQAKGGKNPRPGRVLTDEDIDHYQKIVVALSETIRIMAEIDEVIEAQGGWPDAFVTENGRDP